MDKITKVTSIIVTLLAVLTICSGANIFCIFPTPSYSHQQPLLALSRRLAARGHNLTVITADPSKVPIQNYREIDISLAYKKWSDAQDEKAISLQKNYNPLEMVGFFRRFIEFMTETILEFPQIQELAREVNGEKYDLILYESLYYAAFLGFSDLIGNPPIIGLLTVNTFITSDLTMGNPIIPSYTPDLFGINGDRMTFLERVDNLLVSLGSRFVMERYIIPFQEKCINKYFSHRSIKHTAQELEYNKSLLIVSTDLSSAYPKPVQPNTIYVGPMHLQPPKPLPQDLQKWLDESEDGFIYFSLGSNMKGTSVPEEKRTAFIKAFSHFPKIRVLWKWESDEKLSGQTDNILVKKWLPQQSILAHPKIRFFISQVGLQSFQEATRYGVPILGIPMFGDQKFNAKFLSDSGAGIVQQFHEITYETILAKLTEMITNPSYKENMVRLSKITHDKPMPAVDTAIWWVEYVLRHNGAPHLRPASLDLTWYQYLMLDILLVFIVISVVFLYSLWFIVKLFFSLFTSTSKKKLD